MKQTWSLICQKNVKNFIRIIVKKITILIPLRRIFFLYLLPAFQCICNYIIFYRANSVVCYSASSKPKSVSTIAREEIVAQLELHVNYIHNTVHLALRVIKRTRSNCWYVSRVVSSLAWNNRLIVSRVRLCPDIHPFRHTHMVHRKMKKKKRTRVGPTSLWKFLCCACSEHVPYVINRRHSSLQVCLVSSMHRASHSAGVARPATWLST